MAIRTRDDRRRLAAAAAAATRLFLAAIAATATGIRHESQADKGTNTLRSRERTKKSSTHHPACTAHICTHQIHRQTHLVLQPHLLVRHIHAVLELGCQWRAGPEWEVRAAATTTSTSSTQGGCGCFGGLAPERQQLEDGRVELEHICSRFTSHHISAFTSVYVVMVVVVVVMTTSTDHEQLTVDYRWRT